MNRRDLLKGLSAIPITASVSRLALDEHDTLVLECPSAISCETADRLRVYMETHFPGHKCIVLGDGLKLSVLRHGGKP
jgi:hypothetical protein